MYKDNLWLSNVFLRDTARVNYSSFSGKVQNLCMNINAFSVIRFADEDV